MICVECDLEMVKINHSKLQCARCSEAVEWEDANWTTEVATRPINYKEKMYARLMDVKMPITAKSIKYLTVDQLFAVRYVASMDKLDGLYSLYRREYEARLRMLEAVIDRKIYIKETDEYGKRTVN
jgi:hypothetical protein